MKLREVQETKCYKFTYSIYTYIYVWRGMRGLFGQRPRVQALVDGKANLWKLLGVFGWVGMGLCLRIPSDFRWRARSENQ